MSAFNLFDRPTSAATRVSALFAAAAILLGANPATATIAYSGGVPTSMTLDGVTSAVQLTGGKVTRLGGLSALPALTRSTVAYNQDGSEVAANTLRYRYGRNLFTRNISTAGGDGDTTGFASVAGGTTITRNTSFAYRGASCIKVACDGSAAGQGFYAAVLTPDLKPGMQVTVHCRVRGGGTSLRAILFQNNPSVVVGATSTVFTPSATAWTQVSVTATLPASFPSTAQYYALRIDANGTSQAYDLYVDDLQFEYAAAATAWTEGGPQGGFIEDGVQNLLIYSEGDISTYTTKSGVTDGAGFGRFSSSIAFADNSVARWAYKAPALATNTEYTLSVFVEMDDLAPPVVGTSSASYDFTLILANGAITSTPVVESVGGNVYRVSGTMTTPASIANMNTGVVKYNTQTARGFRVVGIQLVTGPYKGSYVKTDAATFTKASDVLKVSRAGTMRAEEGGVAVKFRLENLKTYDLAVLVDAGNTGVSGFVFYIDTVGKILFKIGDGNSLQTMTSTTTVVAGTDYVAAIKWDKVNKSCKLLVNGVVEASITVPINPILYADQVYIGSLSTTNTRCLNGTIDYVRFWDKAPTDAELALFTATYRPDVEPDRQRVVIPFNGSLAYKARVATLTYSGSELAGITGETVTIAA